MNTKLIAGLVAGVWLMDRADLLAFEKKISFSDMDRQSSDFLNDAIRIQREALRDGADEYDCMAIDSELEADEIKRLS